MGVEPTTFGATIRRSNQLSYTRLECHRILVRMCAQGNLVCVEQALVFLALFCYNEGS